MSKKLETEIFMSYCFRKRRLLTLRYISLGGFSISDVICLFQVALLLFWHQKKSSFRLFHWLLFYCKSFLVITKCTQGVFTQDGIVKLFSQCFSHSTSRSPHVSVIDKQQLLRCDFWSLKDLKKHWDRCRASPNVGESELVAVGSWCWMLW